MRCFSWTVRVSNGSAHCEPSSRADFGVMAPSPQKICRLATRLRTLLRVGWRADDVWKRQPPQLLQIDPGIRFSSGETPCREATTLKNDQEGIHSYCELIPPNNLSTRGTGWTAAATRVKNTRKPPLAAPIHKLRVAVMPTPIATSSSSSTSAYASTSISRQRHEVQLHRSPMVNGSSGVGRSPRRGRVGAKGKDKEETWFKRYASQEAVQEAFRRFGEHCARNQVGHPCGS